MDEYVIFKCEHIENGEAVEVRAVPVGKKRLVAICKECNSNILSSLLPDMIREIARDETMKTMQKAMSYA